MTKFQKITIGLLGALVLIVGAGVAFYVMTALQPVELTHEEKLQQACLDHPGDCDLMKGSNRAVEYEINKLGGALANENVKASVNRLRAAQRRYEERFITSGKYGD